MSLVLHEDIKRGSSDTLLKFFKIFAAKLLLCVINESFPLSTIHVALVSVKVYVGALNVFGGVDA